MGIEWKMIINKIKSKKKKKTNICTSHTDSSNRCFIHKICMNAHTHTDFLHYIFIQILFDYLMCTYACIPFCSERNRNCHNVECSFESSIYHVHITNVCCDLMLFSIEFQKSSKQGLQKERESQKKKENSPNLV